MSTAGANDNAVFPYGDGRWTVWKGVDAGGVDVWSEAE